MALLPKAVLHIVGGTAVRVAFLVGAAVVNSQGNLNLLNQHANEGGKPHPQHGSRSARGHGGGHTCNVAKAHGTANRGGDGLIRA